MVRVTPAASRNTDLLNLCGRARAYTYANPPSAFLTAIGIGVGLTILSQLVVLLAPSLHLLRTLPPAVTTLVQSRAPELAPGERSHLMVYIPQQLAFFSALCLRGEAVGVRSATLVLSWLLAVWAMNHTSRDRLALVQVALEFTTLVVIKTSIWPTRNKYLLKKQ